MANSPEERDKLIFQFVKVHVHLRMESSKLDNLMFNEMAECKVLFNEIFAMMGKEEDILSVFDELDERVSKIFQKSIHIKSAYTEFECMLLKVLCAKMDISTLTDGLRLKIVKNDGWFDEVKKFLDENDSMKVLADINKVINAWQCLAIKQQLEECKAEMKTLLADLSRRFMELWTGRTID